MVPVAVGTLTIRDSRSDTWLGREPPPGASKVAVLLLPRRGAASLRWRL